MHGIPITYVYGVIRQLVETYFGNQDQVVPRKSVPRKGYYLDIYGNV